MNEVKERNGRRKNSTLIYFTRLQKKILYGDGGRVYKYS